MKSIITFLLGFILLVPAMAQDDAPVKDPKAMEKIKAARIAYITEKLGLTPAEAEKFWPIYNEFDKKRDAIKLEAKAIRKNPDPTKSTEENQKAAIAQQNEFKQKELNLEKDYSNRLLNVVSAQKVMSLSKTEKDFNKLLLRRMQQQQALKEQRQLQRDRKDQRQKNN
jgi:signal recognition particle subunit SEC65